MIVPLDLADDETAKAVHRIATQSYTVEAELIGSTAIPGLHESVEDVRGLPLRWLGGYVANDLVAFVGYAKVDGVLDIDRLCVAPSHFRLGFARRLVEQVLAEGGLIPHLRLVEPGAPAPGRAGRTALPMPVVPPAGHGPRHRDVG